MTSSALGNASLFSVSHQRRETGSFRDTAQTPQVLVSSGATGALVEQDTSTATCGNHGVCLIAFKHNEAVIIQRNTGSNPHACARLVFMC